MKGYIFVLLLALALLISWSSASDLKMSTGQKDYYFLVGETAQIPLNISNTYDHDLPGIIRVTTTESTQGPGLSMASSSSQSQSYTVPTGDSVLTIDGGTSTVEKSQAFSISFDFN